MYLMSTPFFQEEGSKGVAEYMGRDLPGHAGFFYVFGDQVAHRLGGEPIAEFGEKDVRRIDAGTLAQDQVMLEGVDDFLVFQEDEPFLVALAMDHDHHLAQIQILILHDAELADPEAAGKEQLQDCHVPAPDEFQGGGADQESLISSNLRQVGFFSGSAQGLAVFGQPGRLIPPFQRLPFLIPGFHQPFRCAASHRRSRLVPVHRLKEQIHFLHGQGSPQFIGFPDIQVESVKRILLDQLSVFQIAEEGPEASQFVLDGLDGVVEQGGSVFFKYAPGDLGQALNRLPADARRLALLNLRIPRVQETAEMRQIQAVYPDTFRREPALIPAMHQKCFHLGIIWIGLLRLIAGD